MAQTGEGNCLKPRVTSWSRTVWSAGYPANPLDNPQPTLPGDINAILQHKNHLVHDSRRQTSSPQISSGISGPIRFNTLDLKGENIAPGPRGVVCSVQYVQCDYVDTSAPCTPHTGAYRSNIDWQKSLRMRLLVSRERQRLTSVDYIGNGDIIRWTRDFS